MELTPHPIVVLGMYRSGTSSLAGALTHLGVFFGRKEGFFPVDAFNQTGYWELSEIMEMNRAILAGFHMTSIHAKPLPVNWAELPGTEWIGHKIGEVLRKHFAEKAVWGWKEPQTCPLMPVYRDAFDKLGLEPNYVICVRNPLDTLASQRDLGPLPLIGKRALGLWLHYTLSALRGSRGPRRTLVVYERFLEDPTHALHEVVNSIEGFKPSEEEWRHALNSVQPALCHSRSSEDALEAYPSILGRTYRLCIEASMHSSHFREGGFDEEIEELWGEWVQWCEMTKSDDLPYGIFTVSWQPDSELQQAKEPFAPKGEWQKLSLRVEGAPAGAPLRVHLYHVPCQAWIRNAVFRIGDRVLPLDFMPGPNGVLEEFQGLRRVGVFGPDHLRSVAPPSKEGFELEMEVLIQSNATISSNLIGLLRGRIDQLRQGRA